MQRRRWWQSRWQRPVVCANEVFGEGKTSGWAPRWTAGSTAAENHIGWNESPAATSVRAKSAAILVRAKGVLWASSLPATTLLRTAHILSDSSGRAGRRRFSPHAGAAVCARERATGQPVSHNGERPIIAMNTTSRERKHPSSPEPGPPVEQQKDRGETVVASS